MKASHIEDELKKLDTAQTELSPLVRSRLDETYAQLSQLSRNRSKRAAPRLRRAVFATTAAGVVGIGLFASAFVSPVMADSLRNIPIIGSIFSTIHNDSGLRLAGDLKLSTTVNREVSHEDVTLRVTEAFYDGNRAAFLLDVTGSKMDNGMYNNGEKTMKLSNAIDNVFFTVNGQEESDGGNMLIGGLFYGSAGEAHPNTLVFEQIMDPASVSAVSDSFTGTITITLDGMKEPLKLEIPFTKTSNSAIEVSPNAVTANGEFTFSVSKVEVTPVTTRLKTSLALTHATTLTEKEELRMRRIGAAVFDDQGRQLAALSGDGIYEGNRLIYDRRYASTPGTSKYLVVKPFVIKDDFAEDIQEDQYIKELETRIELPSH
ncbi:DUF4179 domain-containing protein [Paenibacillus turpanensis]|uniref:DUF4179 domain-containing protein n=1 Tax=Paenibacillus turpanensis TaxID=2689078 RepID=UPI00140E269F|nr:DUF4179 domain-containing protein [Paenibacillus turpanensis]